jgi:hypothetical protein
VASAARWRSHVCGWNLDWIASDDCAFSLAGAAECRHSGKMEKAFLRLSFILPLTGEERIWWIFVSLTAGICEEIRIADS